MGHMMWNWPLPAFFDNNHVAMGLTQLLLTVGKMLEARSKGRTTDALKGLMKLSPKTAVILKDGVETEVFIEEVNKGDIFVVRPGESIPVDGIVLEGNSAVNEAAQVDDFQALPGNGLTAELNGDILSGGSDT